MYIDTSSEQIQPEGGTCSSAEFINGDDDLVTFFETDDSWDQQFLPSLEPQKGSTDDSSEEEEELKPPQLKVRNILEAVFHLENVLCV